MASVLAACGSSSSSGGSASISTSVLRVLPSGAPTTLDPAKWAAEWDQWAMLCMYEGLVSFRPGTRTLVNVLAKSLHTSPDGLKITFELKPGVQFHGGFGEVTAEDVQFSFERIAGLQEKKLQSTVTPDWATLAGVEITGKYTGVIRLKSYFAPLMVSTLPGSSGFIVSKKAVEKYGLQFATHPIGTGPYELQTYTPGNTLQMKRFAQYSGSSQSLAPAPQWGTIIMPLTGAAAGDVGLLSGSVDAAQLAPNQVRQLQQNSQFVVTQADSANYNWINLNQMAPGLTNINVRKAIQNAIDVPSIIEAAFNGLWPRASAAVSPVVRDGYWSDAPLTSQNLDQARSLMKQAGVSSLNLAMTINSGDVGSSTVAQIVQANLKEIGINVQPSAVDTGTFFTLGKGLRKRDLTYVSYTSLPDPAWVLQWFLCNQFDEWNWMYWCNNTFDKLYADALAERDLAKRSAMYVEMQKLWAKAANTVWVTWPREYIGAKKGIQTSFTFWGWPVLWNFRA
jgi:peptide/nickel transport system substrate-binding protein